jgi:hypothetical protein
MLNAFRFYDLLTFLPLFFVLAFIPKVLVRQPHFFACNKTPKLINFF